MERASACAASAANPLSRGSRAEISFPIIDAINVKKKVMVVDEARLLSA